MKTEIPWQAAIQASGGERMIFNVEYTDQDERRPGGAGAWTAIPGTGPYELHFTATNARFDNATTGPRAKVITGLTSGNLDVFPDAGFASATIDLHVADLAPAVAAPDAGSTNDPDYTHTWTITPRGQPPTSMACDSRNFGTNQPAPAVYAYIMNPALAGPRPYYNGQTVLESFQAITANFTMNDLTAAFKTANAGLTTPDQVARFLFNAGGNGTFVIDASDHIGDQHGGFGPTGAFTPAALAAGVGYTLPQVYSCAGTAIGNYTIKRTIVGAAISINKSGP